jgi:hypothetical protein
MVKKKSVRIVSGPRAALAAVARGNLQPMYSMAGFLALRRAKCKRLAFFS